MARRRSRKPKGPKKVSYTLIDRAEQPSVYKALDRIIKAHHRELRDARVALAWCTAWRDDIDGQQKLGQCKRASDLDRELAPFDFVILLNKGFWDNPSVTNAQRDALLDHELCHATVKLNKLTLEPVEDERGRKVYRMRRHDLEEFSEIGERHGMWKKDIAHFARALARAKTGVLPLDEEPAAAVSSTVQ